MKQKNLRIEIPNNHDTIVSLQVSATRIYSNEGERSGEPEAVLLLEDMDERDAIALFTSNQLGEFIKKLEHVKWLLDNWQPKK